MNQPEQEPLHEDEGFMGEWPDIEWGDNDQVLVCGVEEGLGSYRCLGVRVRHVGVVA